MLKQDSGKKFIFDDRVKLSKEAIDDGVNLISNGYLSEIDYGHVLGQVGEFVHIRSNGKQMTYHIEYLRKVAKR